MAEEQGGKQQHKMYIKGVFSILVLYGVTGCKSLSKPNEAPNQDKLSQQT